jgi:hypothetical protein
MPIPIDRLSVCIETVFPPTRSYEEQIRAVASLGFGAYEFWYHDLAKEGAGWVKREKAKDLDLIARINGELVTETTYLDKTVEPGKTYLYQIGAEVGEREVFSLTMFVTARRKSFRRSWRSSNVR